MRSPCLASVANGSSDKMRPCQQLDSSVFILDCSRVTELRWFVIHTKPRREKKVADYCVKHKIPVTLPCYDSEHRYRGKTVVFKKPLFPGYVFVQLEPQQRVLVIQSDHVANLLEVFDQETFRQQLENILVALKSGLQVRLAPVIGEGMRVRIKAGLLRGVEGWVERRYGVDTVLLRLDLINQAAAIRLGASLLEPI